METNSLVSIIIPIYNVSRFIDECIASACSQTYTNVEIILVDDGSPDNCPRKCDEWARVDSRIKVIHKPNGGLSDARNAGLDAATGKYIYFLDGDDYIAPDLIETAIKHMNSGADMVVFNFNTVQESNEITPVSYHLLQKFQLNNDNRLDFLLKTLLPGKIGWEAWNRMYSRNVIESNNLRFADNRVIFAEDLYFCLCYCMNANTIISIPHTLYYYRLRADSIMENNQAKLNIGRFNELSKAVYNYIVGHNELSHILGDFPKIHFMLMEHILSIARKKHGFTPKEFRKLVRSDIQDLRYFDHFTLNHFSAYHKLEGLWTDAILLEKISYYRYLISGNYLSLQIENKFLYLLWPYLDQTNEIRQAVKQWRKYKHRIFYIGSEEFGNIGDHKINASTISFIKKHFPDRLITEISADEWKKFKEVLKQEIKSDDLIVLCGGGNFGDVYPHSHKIKEEVIQLWPDNTKIIFPQTIHFDNKSTLEHAETIFDKANNVILFVRDKKSFEFASEHFTCEIHLCPDIVLSQSECMDHNRTQTALLCLRNDKEKSISKDLVSKVQQGCISAGLSTKYVDLQLDYHVSKNSREDIIAEYLSMWSTAKIVVTDRLHGMIFAAITGTPCMAFDNYNQKLSGTYQFLEYLPYISLVENDDMLQEKIIELISLEHTQFNLNPMQKHYTKLAEVLNRYATDQRYRSSLQG